MFLWTLPVLRVAHAARNGGAAYASRGRYPESKIVSKENQRPRSSSAAAPSRAKGHAATAHRKLRQSLPKQRRVAERCDRCFGGQRGLGSLPCAELAHAPGSSFQPQSGRFPVAPSCTVHVAGNGGRAPTGHQEIGQCPTKCSSMRPIRRRPGWLFCAATVSRNSTSSPPAVSNFAATSIWPR